MGGVRIAVCVLASGCWCLQVEITTKCDGDWFRLLYFSSVGKVVLQCMLGLYGVSFS